MVNIDKGVSAAYELPLEPSQHSTMLPLYLMSIINEPTTVKSSRKPHSEQKHGVMGVVYISTRNYQS